MNIIKLKKSQLTAVSLWNEKLTAANNTLQQIKTDALQFLGDIVAEAGENPADGWKFNETDGILVKEEKCTTSNPSE